MIVHRCNDWHTPGFSGSPQEPCRGVRYADGHTKNTCDEPCAWIMGKPGHGVPGIEPNSQEEMWQVENERYLAAAFFVLPLASGRIGILTARRDLYKIVDTWEEAQAIGPLAGQSARPAPREVPRIKLNLGGLI